MKFFTENSPAYLHLKGLCEALSADDEFQEMRRNLGEFKKDTVAVEQLKTLTEMGNVIRAKQAKKEELLPKEVEDFEALRVEFLSNPVAAAYVDSQEQLLNTRKFIGHFISKTIERGVPPSLKEITDIFENNQHCGTC